MSDNAPLATKAPESDLQEDLQDEPLAVDKETLPSASVPVNEPASSQTLSDHCTTDRPLSSNEPPSGTVSSWNSVDVYISKPSDYPTTPARLLILLPTGAGIHSQNNQHQADLFARRGYLTVMPDLFDKDPAPNSKPTETDENPAEVSWLDTVKLKAAETAKSFMLDMWYVAMCSVNVLSSCYSTNGITISVTWCSNSTYVISAGPRLTAPLGSLDIHQKRSCRSSKLS